MLVNGGKLYWVGNEDSGKKARGIVVVFAWVSIHERHLKNYVGLYNSLGWNCLVCHADFLNAFYPQKATALAFLVLDALIEELRICPCPVMFAAFSGGSKACMYKVLQIIEAKCEGQLSMDDNKLLRNCFSGHIYDSCPSDFTSDLGARFTLHPSFLKMPGSSIVSWVAKGLTSGLDALFLTQFDSQHNEYWQTLYSSIGLGAPFLILCSDSDNLAPYHVICNFAHRLREIGGDVKLVQWSGTSHIGHYKAYPNEYKSAVTNFLKKAISSYSRKILQLEGERSNIQAMPDEISELICNLQKVAVNSNQSLRRVAINPSDHFFIPSSNEYNNGGCDSGSSEDESKEKVVHAIEHSPSINGNSVLGQIMFDACVPKNIEGWDIKFSKSRRPLKGIKCIHRSRL